MNSLERVVAAVGFQEPDRVPVIAQVFGHAAVLAGVQLGEYVRDGELLARCQMKALERYGYDAVFALMDTSVETEAVGARLRYHDHMYPVVERYPLGDPDDITTLRLPDPQRDGRMPELLKAARILRREVGSEVLVAGFILGPMTLAMQLLGPEKTLFLANDDPPLFARILDFALDLAISFGCAQLEAGVHLPVVFDASASSDLIPAGLFREFELPRLKRLFSALKSGGAAASWLYIVGRIEPILPFYPETGAEIANLDYCVDPRRAREILPTTCLDGNIKPLTFVEGSPDEIASEATRLTDLFGSRGGFILSSGCEIPPEAKPENVAALLSVRR